MTWTYARYAENGYEVSSKGNAFFSPIYARLADGRTIEEAYQLDIKGYRLLVKSWREAKGRPPLNTGVDLYKEYLALWQKWARENPEAIEWLRKTAEGKTLTDRFASTEISQARALCDILNGVQE